MKHPVLGAAFALASLGLALPAFAGKGGPPTPPTISKQSRKDNKVFVGINWNWGVRNGATAVVGYRWARVKSNNHVSGALVDLTVVLSGAPVGLGEMHVKGLAGGRSVQGEFGAGYGFQGQAFLLNGGVRAPYANVGTDYLFGKGWQPYVGINTLQRVKAPTETASCPTGFDLTGGMCVTQLLD